MQCLGEISVACPRLSIPQLTVCLFFRTAQSRQCSVESSNVPSPRFDPAAKGGRELTEAVCLHTQRRLLYEGKSKERSQEKEKEESRNSGLRRTNTDGNEKRLATSESRALQVDLEHRTLGRFCRYGTEPVRRLASTFDPTSHSKRRAYQTASASRPS